MNKEFSASMDNHISLQCAKETPIGTLTSTSYTYKDHGWSLWNVLHTNLLQIIVSIKLTCSKGSLVSSVEGGMRQDLRIL